MVVLSLFDGMSCGRIALERVGIPVDMYFASEVDKWAIQVSKDNWGNKVEHVGDVRDIEPAEYPKIDLLIGGSPCQGFSFAGKQLNFDDPRSKLFFEFVRILKGLRVKNPDVKFLLENVRMKKEYQDVISEHLGVQPIMINSALVSAQNRVRLYWTNIPNVVQPEDKGILLRDIIEGGVTDRDKSYCIDSSYYKGGDLNQYFNKSRRQLIFEKYGVSDDFLSKLKKIVHNDKKAFCLLATTSISARNYNRSLCNLVVCGASRGRYLIDGKRQDGKMKTAGLTKQMLEIREDEKTNCLTSVQKDNLLIVSEGTKKGYVEILPNEGVDLSFPNSKTRRGRKMEDKSNCLTAASYDYCWWDGLMVRKLTPIECERLQTVPDNYTSAVSDSQRYKMLGNGWTVDVIAHIFKNLTNGETK